VHKKLPSEQGVHKKRVLLVEDDSSMRRFVKIVLTRANYDVVSVEDGLVALEKAKENVFDAVVADAIMPNLSGFDLFRMLRGDKNYKTTPLVILSGFTDQIPENPDDSLVSAYLEKDTNLGTRLPSILEKLLV